MKTTRNSSSGILSMRRWQTGKRLIVAPSGIVLFIVILFWTLGGRISYGQGVGISESSIVPQSSSILELRSTLRGFLAPRMTTPERLAILLPAQGLLVYDTDKKSFFYWENTSWKAIAATSLGTSNQLLGMNQAADANEYKTLNGSVNILVSFVPGNINLTTSQDIHPAASPTFAGLKITGLTPNSGVYTDVNSFLTSSPPVSGILGYWSRLGGILSPTTITDAITTNGNIYTGGTGTITSAGLLTGLSGATISGGIINLNNTSNFATNINTGTSTGAVTIGNSLNTITLPAFTNAGVVHNSAGGILSSSLIVNNDIANTTIDLTTKVTGILPLANGGTNTNLSAGIIGDLLYANTPSTFARLADVAMGNVLISGGAGVAPSWGKVDLGQHLTGILPLANGGTNADLSLAVSNGGIVWTNATQMQVLAGTPTANKMLLSGASTTPSWSNYVMPSTFAGGGEIMYTSNATTVSNLAAGTTGMYLRSNGTGAPAWQKIDLSSTNEINNILQVSNGGTGISNITTNNLIYGNGTNPVSLLAPGVTTGALLTTTVSGAPGWLTLNTLPVTSGILQVPNGGTGASTLGNHGVIVGQGTNAVAVTGTGTSGQVLQSRGSGADPSYSTAIYPTTTTINELLYSSTGDNITGLTTSNNGVLITSGTGVPSIGSILPDAVQYNITKLGTITNGTWNGSILGLAYGGTNTDLTLGSPAIGDLLYGTATGFARLADVAMGNVLISGGAGVAPSWGKVDLGQHLTGILPLANGGTNADLSLAVSNGGIVWTNATQMQVLAGTPTANKMLLSGASTTPSWSNYVMPSTFAGGGEIMYTSNATTVSNLAAGTTGMYLRSNGTGAPAWQKIDLSSTNEINNILQVSNGGTGISNITTNNLIYGNGTNPVSLLAPGVTTGALLTTTVSGAPGWLTLNTLPVTSGILQVSNGGTGASTLGNHGVIVGQGTNAVAVTGTGTSGQVLQSRGSGADPSYSTAIYPTTTTINELLYSSTGDNITGLTTSNNGVLITSGTGVPSIGSILPDAVQYNITKLGTITNGTWNGSILGLAYGGTNTDLTLGSPAIGDLLYGTATGFARLADAATGNVLISGGAGAPPAWGKVDLGQHLTGILPIANGGTNWNGPLANNRLMISGGGSIIEAPAMVDGQVIVGKLNAAPQVVTLGGDATINNTGALLISNDAISTVKLANNAVTYVKIQAASAFSRLLGSSDASNAITEISLGPGLALSGTTLTALGLGGTVTNFSSGDLSPLFTTSVTNPATTPALSFSLSNAGAYTLFGNFTNAPAPPTYFSPILASALFANQGAASSVLHGGGVGNPSWSQIINGDIDPAAGIADTKLATISTAGKVLNSATTATSANTPDAIVARDGSGNFIAGTITAALSGNATTSTTATHLFGGAGGSIPYQTALSTTAMLANGNAGQVLTSAGGLLPPTWTTPTTGTVTSVTGTANRITIGGTASDPVVDIAGNYVGQNTINTLGTITTGTWNGTTIAVANGGTGQTTQQTAINALAGGVTAGQYLRGDGTNVLMSAIQAADIPNIAESQVTGLVADLASKQAAGNYITALTGDATASGPGSAALTLATVNSNTGAIGSSTAIPTITTNAKGLVTAVTTNAVIAPAGTLTGTTLASNVVTSSLTSVGTLTSLTVTNPISGSVTGNAGTATIATNLALGGPGTIPYQSAANTTAMLGAGAAGQVLTSGGAGAPTWTTPTTGTVTSVTGTANRITVGGTASDPVVDIAGTYIGQNSITTLGTITSGAWNGTTIAIGNGGTGQTTQQAAINALAGGVTVGQYLRGDGTNVLMSAIQAADIPNIAESQVTGLVADLASKQAAGNYITALTGDATASGPGSAALTLATVNSNTGAIGSSTAIPTITTNAKGLVTAVTTNAVIAPAGTLTGTTLASNVVTSSLTSVGTLTNLTVTNPITGSVTGNAGTATIATNLALGGPGTIPYQSAANTTAMLGAGAAGQVLTSGGAGAPTWTTPTTGTVTSVGLALPSFITVSNSPVTGSGTLTGTLASQSANMVFASPNGSAGSPVFRALVSNDIPNMAWAKITTGTPTTLAGYGITDAALASHNHTVDGLSNVTIAGKANNDILQWNGTAWVNKTLSGAGIVTAETDPIVRAISGIVKSDGSTISAAVAGTDYLTPSGSAAALTNFPILNQSTTGNAAQWTTARNLAGNSVDGSTNVNFTNKFIVQGTADAGLSGAQFLGGLSTGLVKNTTTTGVLSIASAGIDYSAGTSALVTGILKSTTGTGTLTIAVAGDFPTLNQNTTGTAANVTGTIAIANGGTGATTKSNAFNALSPMTNQGDIIYGGVGGTGTRLAPGTAGQILAMNAGATAPQWQNAGSGDMILAAAQTVSGVKTFSALPVFSTLTIGSIPYIGAGNALAEDNANLFWDSGNHRLGIGTTTPSTALTVFGDVTINATGTTTASPRTIGINGWGAGNAARYTFGDPWNALQDGYGQHMQIVSYHGVDIAGSRGLGSALAFVPGDGTEASLNVIGTRTGNPVLTVTAAAGQTGNLQEWRNSGGTAISAISSTGGAVINGAFNYGVDVGALNAYAINLSPAPTSYVAGMIISFYANSSNTANCTININGLGNRNIRKRANTVLVANDILNGMVCLLIYDGANFKIMNPIVP